MSDTIFGVLSLELSLPDEEDFPTLILLHRSDAFHLIGRRNQVPRPTRQYEVQLPLPLLDENHCKILMRSHRSQEDDYFHVECELQDFSENGTYVNGTKIHQDKTSLRDQDILGFPRTPSPSLSIVPYRFHQFSRGITIKEINARFSVSAPRVEEDERNAEIVALKERLQLAEESRKRTNDENDALVVKVATLERNIKDSEAAERRVGDIGRDAEKRVQEAEKRRREQVAKLEKEFDEYEASIQKDVQALMDSVKRRRIE